MSVRPGHVQSDASLLASQRTYDDARADEYGDESKPDRNAPGLMRADVYRALIEEHRPTGDVLELACGTGSFTREIVRHAQTVTAVNASSRMLAINRTCVNDPTVRHVHGEIFARIPDRTYDVVFFEFWLSHVPPSAVHDSWTLVRKCLAPHGRVTFVDEDDRAAGHDDVYLISGIPVARRSLSNGRQFEIVKNFWRPDELENGLHSSAWDVQVQRVGETFLYGVGRLSGPGE